MFLNKNYKLEKWLKILRVIIYLIPVLIFLWLINKNFAPFGQWQVTYQNLKKNTSFIKFDDTIPFAGYFENNILHWTLFSDKSKFQIKFPLSFEKIKLNVYFRNTNQPYFFFAAQKRVGLTSSWNLIAADTLDDLTWPTVQEGILTLWQREFREQIVVNKQTKEENIVEEPIRTYPDLKEFFASPPDPDKVAIINFDASSYYQIKNYKPSNENIILDYPLRGSHSFLVYIKDEPLNFNLLKKDLNRDPNIDNLQITVSFSGEEIYQKQFPQNQTDQNQAIKVNLDNLTSGVYRVDLATNEDVVVERIETTNKALVFINRLFLADGPTYFSGRNFKDIHLTTNSTNLNFETPHQEALQSVSILDNKINIDESKKVYSYNLSTKKISVLNKSFGGIYDIYLSKDDLSISGNGYFSFPESTFFDLSREVFGQSIDLAQSSDLDQFDYILANYEPAKKQGDLKVASFEYDTKDLYVKDHSFYFTFYAPGLRTNQAQVEIKKIEIQAEKQPFWKNFRIRLGNLIKRTFGQ